MKKRTIDILGALSALVCFAPLMLLVALAIKCTSAGPIIFSQARMGKDRKLIRVYKFRSMYVSNDDTFIATRREDARVTTIGKLIRRTSIDELPQLFNVLIGNMSLVGPRPHPLALDEHWVKTFPHLYERYGVKPGITGLAQVNGYRGTVDSAEHMSHRISFDLVYVDSGTITDDFDILCRTVNVCLKQTNAY